MKFNLSSHQAVDDNKRKIAGSLSRIHVTLFQRVPTYKDIERSNLRWGVPFSLIFIDCNINTTERGEYRNRSRRDFLYRRLITKETTTKHRYPSKKSKVSSEYHTYHIMTKEKDDNKKYAPIGVILFIVLGLSFLYGYNSIIASTDW